MKIKLLVTLFCAVSILWGASFPSEIKLVNGVTMRGVSPVRWDNDTIVLKHLGGVDRIRYDQIAEPYRSQVAKLKDGGMETEQKKSAQLTAKAQEQEQAKKEAEAIAAKEKAKKEKMEDAMAHYQVIVGMTKEQVKKTWGEPSDYGSKYTSGSTTEWWYYNGRGRNEKGQSTRVSLAFDEGVLTYIVER